jgi:hypothetical protein
VIKLAFVIASALLVALLLLLVKTIRRLSADRDSGRRRLWRARFNVALVLFLLIILLCGIWATLIEPNRLVVHQQTIQVQNWPAELSGLRVALIGDVHAGSPFIDVRKLRQIVELTNQQNPDLIVLLGDYMSPDSWHSHKVEPEVTAGILRDLRAPLGIYSVLGNHDWWYDGARVRHALEANGIHVLEEETAEIHWRNGSFWLIGFADLWTRPQHIQEAIRKAPEGAATIGLSHNPDMFIHMPRTMPLMLAAHTHGGQVKLPLFGTPIVPSYFGPRYTAGHVIEEGRHMFITTGIGTSILPVRFRVPPEIVILTIR